MAISIVPTPVNGIAPAVATQGTGDEVVLLLHAIGLSWEMWRPVFPHLSGDMRVVAPDLRGHASASAAPPESLEQHAADTVALMDALGIERAHVVGLSYGGAVAQHLALDHPSRVASLVVVASFSKAPSPVLEARAQAAERDGMPPQIDETLHRWFSPEELHANDDGVRYARAQLGAVTVRNWATSWRVLARHDVTDRLANLCMPVTLVAGEHDAAASPAAMRDGLASHITGSQLAVVGGAYHMISLEQPRALSLKLQEHLARAAGRR